MSFKTSLLSVAVLLALSSCGKNKELKTGPEATPPAATTTPAEDDAKKAPPAPSTDDQAKNDDTKTPGGKKSGGKKDDGKSGSKADDKNKDDAKNEDQSEDDNQHSGRDTGRGQQQPKPPVKQVEVKRAQKLVIDIDTAQPAAKTGGTEKELFYTGAGTDGIMNEFKAKSATVSAEQQRMNSNLAKAVVGARLSKSVGQDLIIDLAIDERIKGVGSVKNYRLKAQPAGNVMKLTSITQSGGGDLEFQGGYLKCLDLDGQCENSYAKIKMSGAYTRVIFRKSLADVYFLTQQYIQNNLAFDVLKTYALNAKNDIQTSQKIEAVETSSYEVTNGCASMGVAVTTGDKELIGLSVPLLVSGSGSAVDTGVAKLSDVSKSYDLVSSAGYSSKISDSITDARLVANNGQGQLKVKLEFASGSNTGSIWLVISKKQKRTMSVSEVQAFEATVKSF